MPRHIGSFNIQKNRKSLKVEINLTCLWVPLSYWSSLCEWLWCALQRASGNFSGWVNISLLCSADFPITNQGAWDSQTPNLQVNFLKIAITNINLNFQNQIPWKNMSLFLNNVRLTWSEQENLCQKELPNSKEDLKISKLWPFHQEPQWPLSFLD